MKKMPGPFYHCWDRKRANRDLFILCFSLGKGFLFLMYKRTFPGQGAGELEGRKER